MNLSAKLTSLTILLLLAGCKDPRIVQANDQLRQQNLELQQRVDELEQSLENRIAQLDQLQQQMRDPDAAPPDVDPEQIPRVASISLGRYSGLIDTDGDQIVDTLRIHLRPLDQFDHMIPVTGQVTVAAHLLPAEDTPILINRKTFSRDQLRDAYRSSFMGVHYTLDLPLNSNAVTRARKLGSIAAAVTLIDASRNLTFRKQQVFTLP